MSDSFKSTHIWTEHLATRADDPYEEQRGRLRHSYLSFRDKVKVLVEKIQAALPGLTVHDVSHLDGLWEAAETIAGNDYPLNPLEVFVFGGAVLLHDAALCFEAYEGGLDKIRGSTEWKDAFAIERQNTCSTLDQQQSFSDFAALRLLHANRAAELAEMSWTDPDTGQEIYLIEDSTIRKHLGQLIGDIAASHHWNIERVNSDLDEQVPALADFPREWRIDPVKVACMLRCADAAHISHDRAPDFLHALIRRKGISFNHWQAQNWLSRLDIDQSDTSGQTALIRSTRKFGVPEVDSWWVAYDAIELLQKELKTSNSLLASRELDSAPPFRVKLISGNGSPERLSRYVSVEGWEPCAAEIHVSNIEGLVANLGGEKLYGDGQHQDNFQVVLRELIQNARDAVQARRVMDASHTGEILIRIRKQCNDTWIDVEDDGIGMSRRVMTEPFLDFGTSFWSTDLVKQEFPGLVSSSFRSVGQFGIGFYSVFMICQSVLVTSKHWKSGVDTQHRLVFDQGINLRPLLQRGPFADLSTSCSTKISLLLKERYQSFPDGVEIRRNTMNIPNLKIQFSDYIAALTTGLDVNVRLVTDSLDEIIHHAMPLNDPEMLKNWLHTISFSKDHPDNRITSYVESHSKRLRPIEENGRLLGVAAIYTEVDDNRNCLCADTIGGLATNVHDRSAQAYVGYMERYPKSAKRDQGELVATQATLAAWAEEQRELIKSANLGLLQTHLMCTTLTQFGVDPIDDASAIVNLSDTESVLLNILQLANLLKTRDIALFKRPESLWADRTVEERVYGDCATILPIRHNEYIKLELEGDIPVNNFSLIDCLHRTAVRLGFEPSWKIHTNVTRGKFAEEIDALVCSFKRNDNNQTMVSATPSSLNSNIDPKMNRKERRK